MKLQRSLSRSGSLTRSGPRRGKNLGRKRGRRKSSGRRLSSGFSGISAVTSSGGGASGEGLRVPSQTSSRSAEREALRIHKEVIEQARYMTRKFRSKSKINSQTIYIHVISWRKT